MGPFSQYTEYDRDELLDFVGSKQQQQGIIWGPLQPGCFIATSGGRHGTKAGYEDKQNGDGSWYYFGQGLQGDHNPKKYANKLLIDGQKTVLLFSTREPTSYEAKLRKSYKKLYRFEGYFGVASYETYKPNYGKRKGDRLLRFHLIPSVDNAIRLEPKVAVYNKSNYSIEELRDAILEKGHKPENKSSLLTNYYLRSKQVKIYAHMRAKGICEYCLSAAPFKDINNRPYLEVHHMKRLVDDGPDTPENVAALCPNCHRNMHYGLNNSKYSERLIELIGNKESLPKK